MPEDILKEIKGNITIYDGKKEDGNIVYKKKNLFLNIGKKNLLLLLSGQVLTIGQYDFLGISDTTGNVGAEDTTLANEKFKKPVSDITVYGSTRIVVDTYIDTSEANFTWKQLGLYSGGSWDTLNSGKLINKANVDLVKTNSKAKTISWEIILN